MTAHKRHPNRTMRDTWRGLGLRVRFFWNNRMTSLAGAAR
jgi:hypothetical protein